MDRVNYRRFATPALRGLTIPASRLLRGKGQLSPLRDSSVERVNYRRSATPACKVLTIAASCLLRGKGQLSPLRDSRVERVNYRRFATHAWTGLTIAASQLPREFKYVSTIRHTALHAPNNSQPCLRTILSVRFIEAYRDSCFGRSQKLLISIIILFGEIIRNRYVGNPFYSYVMSQTVFTKSPG